MDQSQDFKRIGTFHLTFRDANGAVMAHQDVPNLVVNEGLDYTLESSVAGGTQITSWYIGLIDGSPTVAAGDTLTSHSGWNEVTVYNEANRQAWVSGTVSGQSVDNSASPATFTINANNTTIGGAFMCSAQSGTSGTLLSAGAATQGDQTIGSGATVEVTYTQTASSS